MRPRPPRPRQDNRYQDAHWEDDYGPLPTWTSDSRDPWKPGQSLGAFIWPRDKRISNTPLRSWRRWKDVFAGKGPGIWLADRRRFAPTRAHWSNWDDPVFDSLGYRSEPALNESSAKPKRYDFRKRKYTENWLRPEVWSDAKWGNDSEIPLYFRDGWGHEWTRRNGSIYPFDNSRFGNDFRYRHQTHFYDWARPEPAHY